jgi:hypothetical protein
MALKLLVALSKKVPGPLDFSSIQASCSIEGELSTGQDAAAEAARLYAQAELAVDRQLGIGRPHSVPLQPAAAPPFHAPPSPSPPLSASPAAGTTHYPSSGGRRAPSLISAAQGRFLRQLLERNPGAHERILAEHRIPSIDALTSRTASLIIDQIKAASS